MGEAAARKVIEIDEARARLEADLLELEERMPAPLRSVKSIVGVLAGSAIALFVLTRRRRSRRSGPAAEVVVKIVREDR
jgi:hypothetical protein